MSHTESFCALVSSPGSESSTALPVPLSDGSAQAAYRVYKLDFKSDVKMTPGTYHKHFCVNKFCSQRHPIFNMICVLVLSEYTPCNSELKYP